MKILIVSPFFPPATGIAVVRISSLVREMVDHHFNVKVLCNEADNMGECFLGVERSTVNVTNESYFSARKKYIKEFKKIMDNNNFDLVLITMGPFYTIDLCTIAEKTYKTPCVLDFRDLWIFDIRRKREFLKPSNLVKKLLYLPKEYRNIKNATAIITVTENWIDILNKIYRVNDKTKLISNGYDSLALNIKNTINKETFEGKFIIAIFGKLSYYSLKHGVDFFKSVRRFIDEHPNTIVLHIGEKEKNVEIAIKKTNFSMKNYINTGFISYAEGMDFIKSSNVNILIDIRSGAMGTKIYDYIYANKPIIYFGSKGTILQKEVEQFTNGFVTFNTNELLSALNHIKESQVSTLSNNTDMHKYSRRYQNERYIELIKSIKK